MHIKRIHVLYFSPTGNTKTIALTLGAALSEVLQVPCLPRDYTLPEARNTNYTFAADDFLILATPVYAGRIPNKLLPFIQTGITGDGTPAMAVAVYGNRSYDNALAEMQAELTSHGFAMIAGAGVPTEHVFSDLLGTGRPNAEDLATLSRFGRTLGNRLASSAGETSEAAALKLPGAFPAPYYKPLGIDGKPAVFLKAKPKTDPEKCIRCGVCSAHCPMGSIDQADPALVRGVCIKCQACIKKCPTQAKYFDDPAFLSHVEMLKKNYTGRKEIEFFR